MLLRLVLYVDDAGAAFPLDNPCVRLYNTHDLYAFLAKTILRPPRVVFYWNFNRSRYEPLTSLGCLRENTPRDDTDARVKDNAKEATACLLVETRPLRLDPVDPVVDVDEYAELQAHVMRWTGNTGVSYSLQSALRVTDPCAARLFDHVRCEELAGNSEDIELLYYTNNSLSSEDVLRNGFSLAEPPTNDGLFVFSSSVLDGPSRLAPTAGPKKILLCEVAPGRAWVSDAPLWRCAAAPPAGYDSARHRDEGGGRPSVSLRVGRSHQALARYVLTIRPNGSNDPRGLNGSNSPSGPRGPNGSNSPRGLNGPNGSSGPRGPDGGCGGRSALRGSRGPSVPRCASHPGTALGLWCARCAALVCPYCAAVGEHRGHRVADADAVADDAHRRVQGLCHDLSMRLDHYRRARVQLAAEQAQLKARVRDAARAMSAGFAELHGTIEARRRVCVRRVQALVRCLDAPLREAARVVRRYEDAVAPLERAWAACGGSSVAFLSDVPRLMREGERFASEAHDAALEDAVAAAKESRAREECVLHVDCAPARRCIERLGSSGSSDDDDEDEDEKSKSNINDSTLTNDNDDHNGDGAVAAVGSSLGLSSFTSGGLNGSRLARLSTAPGATTPQRRRGTRGGSPAREGRRQRRIERQRLTDVRRGYIWSVYDASRHFHPNQRRAVCSRPFTLLGLRWELRIQAAAAKKQKEVGKDAPDNARDEPLGIFLYPVEHTQRMDFRIVFFSADAWAEWDVTEWAPAFAGKGWGVYPLLSRREMMQTDRFARDNTVKVCIVPVSELY